MAKEKLRTSLKLKFKKSLFKTWKYSSRKTSLKIFNKKSFGIVQMGETYMLIVNY